MQIAVVSLFPEMVGQVVEYGVVGRAISRGLVSLGYTDPRDFADDVHRTVDDRPYGGGPGMVMTYRPLRAAVTAGESSVVAPQPAAALPSFNLGD